MLICEANPNKLNIVNAYKNTNHPKGYRINSAPKNINAHPSSELMNPVNLWNDLIYLLTLVLIYPQASGPLYWNFFSQLLSSDLLYQNGTI
jgi:hypothetical protein